MLKSIIYFFVFLFLKSSLSIGEIRVLYTKAYASKEAAVQLAENLESIKETDRPLLVAYKAASITLKAKHAKKIKDKKIYFKKGVALLERIIAQNKNSIELRLIRLSIQENAPKLLKYHKNKSEDAHFIYTHLQHTKNKAKKAYIKAYVLQSKSFSNEEKNVISEF